LVSIHVALRQALEAVTYNNVLESLRITHQSLSLLLGRPPKIGVAGLNPHAGEGGLFGREEIDIIRAGLQAARARRHFGHGPLRARHSLHASPQKGQWHRQNLMLALAMYHDQGLIPVKYMGLEQGVNVTLGSPFIGNQPRPWHRL
jgi:4-hydroxythreonine-4-phosphate dehydrogenase